MGAVELSLLSAFFFAVGHALQKQGVARRLRPAEARIEAGPGTTWLLGLAREPIWVVGFCTVLLASALDLQAVSLGDLTLVKPLLGLQAGFAIAIGVGALGERLGRRELGSLLLLLPGALLVAVSGSPEEAAPAEPLPSAPIFAATSLVVAGILALQRALPGRVSGEIAYGLAAGLLFGISDFMMKLGTTVVSHEEGGFSVLNPSSLAALLRTPEILWIACANLGAFLCMQLAYARGRVAVISPLASLSGTVYAVALGFALLAEPLSVARVAGILVVLFATTLLLRTASSQTNERSSVDA